ncbi:glycosyltransferase family 4 protein [Spirosoma sp. RP8]|uniref:Glycosyltransferase family 4 protein n=1 Tax=Spirosoma liriopis TaxID=2937440 RepID=A0ABT0HJF6_9BACT|nr:glycosyltransferase family 1 protein [Spirosoma liriopis]MCK8492298.1 glycosyltransferase family 4 protein [Spirosoma liriopis]
MKIFFDHQTFSNQLYGGISRYICELVNGINIQSEHTAHLSVLWSNNIHLKEYNIKKYSYPFSKRHRLLVKSNELFNKIDFKIGNYNIYHATYFSDFLVNSAASVPIPIVTTFYDMNYELLADRFAELAKDSTITLRKKAIAQRSTHIIAISESTKKDLVNILDINPSKISVIHLASSFKLNTDSILKEARQPYLLYVGNRDGYKNFVPFLQSIAHILKKYKVKLVCAGGGHFNRAEASLLTLLEIKDLVDYATINDKSLQNLYYNATAFIFPSLYEGFGIPVLEAFACDCPCIVSNRSSLPEVAGDAALYIDPEDPESISSAVEKLILDDTLRDNLIEKGRLRLKMFTWEKTVRKTLDLYSDLLQN